MLRVVLIGYGELASSLMLGIQESQHKLVGILTWEKIEYNPVLSCFMDIFCPSKLNSLIKAYNVNEINAKSANSDEFRRQLLRLQPDVVIIGSWGEILKKETIILPKVACVNCHPSLLPKHRGSNPYTSVIRYCETKTGVTFHLVDEKIDSGPILLQKEITILNEDTGGTLRTKCAYKARESVKELLDGLETAQFLPKKQNEADATYYPRITDDDGIIDWNRPAQNIHDQIRGLQPWMSCYTKHKNQFLMIKSSRIINLKNPAFVPGEVIDKTSRSLLISTLDPDNAILLENPEVYGFINKLWSGYYINKSIKIGDLLE